MYVSLLHCIYKYFGVYILFPILCCVVCMNLLKLDL